jgi:hypothetical protein
VVVGAIATASDAILAISLQHATATENLAVELGQVLVSYRA